METEVKGGKYGVKETCDVLMLGGALLKAGKGVWADKKVDMADINHLFTLFPHIQPALDNLGAIPKELGELDKADQAVLLKKFDEAFGTGAFVQIGAHALQIGMHVLAIIEIAKAA